MHPLRPGGPLPHPLSIIAKRTSSSAEGGALLSQTSIPSDPSKFVQMEGVLQWLHDTLPLQILIDCVADDDFIDANIAAQANIPVMELPYPKDASALDGKLLNRVTHHTTPITLTLPGNHHESTELFVISSPFSPVVLGLKNIILILTG